VRNKRPNTGSFHPEEQDDAVNILVIGASRGIGAHLVEQALAGGHRVTALVRNPSTFKQTGGLLQVVQGDIRDPDAVYRATVGQDAVGLAIGCRPSCTPISLFSTGTAHVLAAMRAHRVGKLVCVTGIGAGDSRGHGGFVYDRLIRPVLLRTMYDDKERQERAIRESDRDWVIVRPVFLTNGPLTGAYAVRTDLAGVRAGKISRADVAHFMLGQMTAMNWRHMAPLVTT
jgi:putative NADH-flavin reductase